jgi:hypothetical protein
MVLERGVGVSYQQVVYELRGLVHEAGAEEEGAHDAEYGGEQ